MQGVEGWGSQGNYGGVLGIWVAATVQGFVRRHRSFFRSSGCRSGQCVDIDATDLRGSLQLRAVGIMHHKLVTLLPIWTVVFSWQCAARHDVLSIGPG